MNVLLVGVVITALYLPCSESRYIPEFDRPLANMTVTSGHEAVFSCHVTHLGGYKVGWIKSDSKAIQAIHTHVITHNPRVSVRHYGTQTWQLVISNVQREDEGAYMCQINTDPMKSQISFLRVVVPPEIETIDAPNDVMIPEGNSVKLSCKARGIPTPTVRWHREDGEEINMRAPNGERLRYSTYEGDSLKLSKVSRLDMGVYVCTASNGVPPIVSRRMMLNVNFNPVVHVPNQLIWSSSGNNFTMECFVEASPRSINYWVKGDGELVISSSKYAVSEIRDSMFAVRMTLTVHSFQSSDTGRYRCIAKNSLGEVEGRIHVYESKIWTTNQVTKSTETTDDPMTDMPFQETTIIDSTLENSLWIRNIFNKASSSSSSSSLSSSSLPALRSHSSLKSSSSCTRISFNGTTLMLLIVSIFSLLSANH